jgi:hypothetical protein
MFQVHLPFDEPKIEPEDDPKVPKKRKEEDEAEAPKPNILPMHSKVWLNRGAETPRDFRHVGRIPELKPPKPPKPDFKDYDIGDRVRLRPDVTELACGGAFSHGGAQEDGRPGPPPGFKSLGYPVKSLAVDGKVGVVNIVDKTCPGDAFVDFGATKVWLKCHELLLVERCSLDVRKAVNRQKARERKLRKQERRRQAKEKAAAGGRVASWNATEAEEEEVRSTFLIHNTVHNS